MLAKSSIKQTRKDVAKASLFQVYDANSNKIILHLCVFNLTTIQRIKFTLKTSSPHKVGNVCMFVNMLTVFAT